MTTATQRRPQTSAPSDGSRTITLRDAQPRPEDDAGDPRPLGVLKLRGAQGRRARRHVAWGADVVDNEGCGKRKSKLCCIYHKPRRFDESSSESESESESEGEEGWGYGEDRARPTGRCRRASHGRGCGHDAARRESGQDGTVHELRRPESDLDANAYERAPKRKN